MTTRVGLITDCTDIGQAWRLSVSKCIYLHPARCFLLLFKIPLHLLFPFPKFPSQPINEAYLIGQHTMYLIKPTTMVSMAMSLLIGTSSAFYIEDLKSLQDMDVLVQAAVSPTILDSMCPYRSIMEALNLEIRPDVQNGNGGSVCPNAEKVCFSDLYA